MTRQPEVKPRQEMPQSPDQTVPRIATGCTLPWLCAEAFQAVESSEEIIPVAEAVVNLRRVTDRVSVKVNV